MKKFLLTATFITLSSALVFAQKTKDEQEVLQVNADYDKAILKGDISFHEKLFAPEYISYNPDGSYKSRSEVIEEIKKEKAAPTYKFTALTSDDVKVKVSGNLAVVTGGWKSTTSALDGDAEPHNDQGRYTAIYEKRNGRWLLLSDHATEKSHTQSELEPGLKKASEDYDKAWETKNAVLFAMLLTDDYMSTNENGKTRNKADDIAQMTDPDIIITTSKTDDKKFRIYRSAAVETGRYTVTGTFKEKPFLETGRYTSTWIYKDGKWKMAADHTSLVSSANTTAPDKGN